MDGGNKNWTKLFGQEEMLLVTFPKTIVSDREEEN